VGDDVHRAEAERLRQRPQVIGVVPQPARGVHQRRLGLAEAAEIHRDPAHAVGQERELLGPDGAAGQVAVHEQDRLAGARLADMALEAAGPDRAVRHYFLARLAKSRKTE
jgi:hypothetical protein